MACIIICPYKSANVFHLVRAGVSTNSAQYLPNHDLERREDGRVHTLSNARISLLPLGPAVYASICSIPPSSTILVWKFEYTLATVSFISCMAKLLPTHILPPLPNAQNQRPISVLCASEASSQRDGFQVKGEGKTRGLRWRV